MFLIKHIISRFLHPVPILVLLLLAGLILRKWEKTRRFAKSVLITDALLFAIMFFGVFNFALKSLETQYKPFDGDNQKLCEELRGAIVTVLGQGLETEDVPARMCDNDCLRQRISEGAYVAHAVPESTLLISMSGNATLEHKQDAIRQYAATYGISTNRIAFYGEARDTDEEAKATMEFAGTNKVVLVTSASHMPRSMRIFRRYNCTPTPAPCEFKYFGPNARFTTGDWHMGFYNIERFERLLHESFGLVYECFK